MYKIRLIKREFKSLTEIRDKFLSENNISNCTESCCYFMIYNGVFKTIENNDFINIDFSKNVNVIMYDKITTSNLILGKVEKKIKTKLEKEHDLNKVIENFDIDIKIGKELIKKLFSDYSNVKVQTLVIEEIEPEFFFAISPNSGLNLFNDNFYEDDFALKTGFNIVSDLNKNDFSFKRTNSNDPSKDHEKQILEDSHNKNSLSVDSYLFEPKLLKEYTINFEDYSKCILSKYSALNRFTVSFVFKKGVFKKSKKEELLEISKFLLSYYWNLEVNIKIDKYKNEYGWLDYFKPISEQELSELTDSKNNKKSNYNIMWKLFLDQIEKLNEIKKKNYQNKIIFAILEIDNSNALIDSFSPQENIKGFFTKDFKYENTRTDVLTFRALILKYLEQKKDISKILNLKIEVIKMLNISSNNEEESKQIVKVKDFLHIEPFSLDNNEKKYLFEDDTWYEIDFNYFESIEKKYKELFQTENNILSNFLNEENRVIDLLNINYIKTENDESNDNKNKPKIGEYQEEKNINIEISSKNNALCLDWWLLNFGSNDKMEICDLIYGSTNLFFVKIKRSSSSSSFSHLRAQVENFLSYFRNEIAIGTDGRVSDLLKKQYKEQIKNNESLEFDLDKFEQSESLNFIALIIGPIFDENNDFENGIRIGLPKISFFSKMTFLSLTNLFKLSSKYKFYFLGIEQKNIDIKIKKNI